VTVAAVNYTWYGARAGGILAFVLLTATIVVGLLMSGRARLEGWPRFAVEDVHRFLGLLTGAFIVLHVGFLLVDSYLPFSLTNVLVPGTAPYRPVSVAAGVIAAELLAALAIANRYRKSLSYGFWRRTHYLNFGVWLLAFVHGIVSGTDTTTAWAAALYLGSAAAVAGLTAGRVALALTVHEGRAPVR
jgi:predicted ferric reductase